MTLKRAAAHDDTTCTRNETISLGRESDMSQFDALRAVPRRRSTEGYSSLALTVSFALVGILVLTASRAAFTDTADNTGSEIAAGNVVLTNDDLGSALFAVSNMAPGDAVTECISVTYGGSITSTGPVRLYSGGYTESAELSSHLNLTIEEGTGAEFGDCTGFASEGTAFDGTLAAFGTAHGDYATGAGGWQPTTSPESKSYRITLELDTATPNSQQGATVSDLVFTWEVST